MNCPVEFQGILDAEVLQTTLRPGSRGNSAFEFGFAVSTLSRNFELYTTSSEDAERWVDAFKAAQQIAKGRGGFGGWGRRPSSRSQDSESTAEGSGHRTPRSPDSYERSFSDVRSRALPELLPWQLPYDATVQVVPPGADPNLAPWAPPTVKPCNTVVVTEEHEPNKSDLAKMPAAAAGPTL